MSGETLRRAAVLMRSRVASTNDGPWVQNGFEYDDVADSFTYDISQEEDPTHSFAYAEDRDTADYIASWHPAVALAVADSLDQAAAIVEEADNGPLQMAMGAICEPLVAVARAYLGETS